MTKYDAEAICRVLERAGIPHKLIVHFDNSAEIALLGIHAYGLGEVLEIVEEHFPADPGIERVLSEIGSSVTIDQSLESMTLSDGRPQH